jgi:hypothetical protein
MPNILFCLTTLALGVRHGLDLDHVTAIADLVGSQIGAAVSEVRVTVSGPSAKAQSCVLASAYAGGHAAVVSALGISALCFCTVLPAWIDPVMEKVVGTTLLTLGAWMLYSLYRTKNDHGEVALQSRGMLLLKGLVAAGHWLDSKIGNEKRLAHVHQVPKLCDWKCAASIGAIHGVGAETGTQVLLITSLAGAGDLSVSLLMLSCFLFGMLLSSVSLAVLVSEGYYRALVSSRWLAVFGTIVAAVSIIVGGLMISGQAQMLPSLDSILNY